MGGLPPHWGNEGMSTDRPPKAGARQARRIHGRRRRRRGRRALLAGGGALAVAVGCAMSVTNFAAVDLADAAVERAKSFMDLMARRSPGERVEGQLIKTKRKHFRVLAERPVPEIP